MDLSQCRDHGIDGFERYTALAILSRNDLYKKCRAIKRISMERQAIGRRN